MGIVTLPRPSHVIHFYRTPELSVVVMLLQSFCKKLHIIENPVDTMDNIVYNKI